MSIYVETLIRAPMEEVWRLTQTPALHARWDVRFSAIEYLPRPDESEPQRFLYQTRIGFGLAIRGEGETVGERADAGGARTSALKFWSDDAKSLIREGSGFWKYEPVMGADGSPGVRFFTRYNYTTRFGLVGRAIDAVFKPLIGWATAWSFDALRLWAERGLDPILLRERALMHAVARLSLAFIWIYQGVFPKLLFPDGGELAILRATRLFSGLEKSVLQGVGWAEVGFGLVFLFLWRVRGVFWLNGALLIALLLGALRGGTAIFVAPFNPVTLTLAMIALSVCGWVTGRDLPSTRHCRRQPAKDTA